MTYLELKIPPVLFFSIQAILMWLTSLVSADSGINGTLRLALGLFSLILGAGIALAGVVEFRRARTSVNPLNPDDASSIVSKGIFKYTRNPMYLGLLLGLFSWACCLDNLYTLFFVLFFPIYMTQFQIKPEEKLLESNFGKGYALYKTRVRRWL